MPAPKQRLTPDEIRKIVLTAVAADDVLVEQLVLKGGNALDLVHDVGRRSSFDVDYSIASGDFEDSADAARRLERSLIQRFDAAGYVAFDYRFEQRPPIVGPDEQPTWGGYRASFKLLPREVADRFRGSIEKMRFNAVTTGEGENRTYEIEISKNEYCEGKEEVELDAFKFYVYTPAMIAAEKLRAICQQDTSCRAHPAPRARDFYDIHAIASEKRLDLGTPQHLELLKRMFEVKEVPFDLLTKIAERKEFHRAGWPKVEQEVRERRTLQDFDAYFEFVVKLAARLHALGVEQPPLS